MFSNFKMPSFSMPKMPSMQRSNPSGGGVSAQPTGAGIGSRFMNGLSGIGNSPAVGNFMSGLKQVGGAMLPALAPQIGQAIGNSIGGTAGQMVSQMGQAYGNPYGQTQEPQYGPQRSAQDYIQQGNQMGQNAIQQGQDMFGNAANNAINQYIPQQMQGMNFGNMGQNFGGMASDFLNRYLPQGQNGQPGLGDIFGGMAGNYLNQGIQQYVPNQFQNTNFGNMGGYLAGRGGDMARGGLDYGTNFAQQKADKFMPYNPQYGQRF
jgi:hypothetical protein